MDKKVILIGVPHHCNLGDHAIAIAEKQFIKKYFPQYKYEQVDEEKVHIYAENYDTTINQEDIIMFHGGGNLGNEYMFIEEGRRKIVQLYPNNIIIAFPQTIYFDDTPKGQEEFEISKKIYGNHKNMIFMAREEKSYEIMKNNFKNNRVYLTPDIVTVLNESGVENERNGALIILRQDLETKVSKEVNEKIEEILIQNYDKVERTDTAQGGQILEEEKEKKLNDMLDKYRQSQLVVTDRLHGMIFAAITGTPCIAFDNYNHKIKYTSKWLQDGGYIRYIENYSDLDKFKNAVSELKKLSNLKYDNKFAIDIFDKVMEEIKNKVICESER